MKIVGDWWYLLALERNNDCCSKACNNNDNCTINFFCGHQNMEGYAAWDTVKNRFFRDIALSMSLMAKNLTLISKSTQELSPLVLSHLGSLSYSTSVCVGDYIILVHLVKGLKLTQTLVTLYSP